MATRKMKSKNSAAARPKTHQAIPAKRSKAAASTRRGNIKANADLLVRGKRLIGDAYHWAYKTGRDIPRASRDLHLPDQRLVQEMVEKKPLVLGAIGLGIGMVIGAMLPPYRNRPRRGPSTRRRQEQASDRH